MQWIPNVCHIYSNFTITMETHTQHTDNDIETYLAMYSLIILIKFNNFLISSLFQMTHDYTIRHKGINYRFQEPISCLFLLFYSHQ